jgi:hypothetical protein
MAPTITLRMIHMHYFWQYFLIFRCLLAWTWK